MGNELMVVWCLLFSLSFTPIKAQSSFFPENLYKGGEEAFYNDLGKNIRYPEAGIESAFYGTILASLQISPQGVLEEIIILNGTPATDDLGLQQLITESLTQWQAFEEQRQVILPIRYSIGGDYGKLIGLSAPTSCNCLSEMVITPGASEPEIDYLEEFNHLTALLENSLKEEDHETSLRTLSDLIRINPYVKDFYEQRIQIERISGIKEYLCGDIIALERLFGILIDDRSDCDL